MKKNHRAAHAADCFWNKHLFKLWRRAPLHTPVAQWEGMPQTTTTDRTHFRDAEENFSVFSDTEYYRVTRWARRGQGYRLVTESRWLWQVKNVPLLELEEGTNPQRTNVMLCQITEANPPINTA